MNFLQGYKTYIIGVVALIIIGASMFGIVDANTANTILSILGFGGLISLRAAVSKI